MCVICVKEKGVQMPTVENIKAMWDKNPDGAGFMFARNGKVYIQKGFMKLSDFLKALDREKFTNEDVVIMHFRISTQAGVNKEMTHPFALCNDIKFTKEQNVMCDIGIAHNGIIQLTTDKNNKEYSDTALFIANYMTRFIRKVSDCYDAYNQKIIEELARSKFTILTNEGKVVYIGKFETKNGLKYSNLYHEYYRVDFQNYVTYYSPNCKNMKRVFNF